MAAVVNPEAWTCGADEEFTIYNWQNEARTLELDITGRAYRRQYADLLADATGI